MSTAMIQLKFQKREDGVVSLLELAEVYGKAEQLGVGC